MKTFAALSLLLAVGCGQSPAGLVLVFPTDAEKLEAAHANILVVRPLGDRCPQFLDFPPVEPDQADILQPLDVDLMDGVPTKQLKGVLTGNQTLLVKVQNQQNVLFLHGCRTGLVSEGGRFEILLERLGNVLPDLTVVTDGPVDDLATPPPDLAQHKILTVNVSELRAPSRKIQGANVTVRDSASMSGSAMSDAMGAAKIDVTGFTAPFSIVVDVPITGGFAGGTAVTAVSPNLTTNTATVNVPVELDPPATGAGNVISVSVTDDNTLSYDVYAQGTSALASDPIIKTTIALGSGSVGPLAMTGSYRVAVTQTGKLATPTPVSGVGSTYSLVKASLSTFAQAMTIAYKQNMSGAYSTSQTYTVHLVLPAAPGQAAVPIVTPGNIAGNTTSPALTVPAAPTAIQGSAILQTAQIGVGPNARAEVRHNVTAGTPADVFTNPVPDPPNVIMPSPSPSPSPFPSTSAFQVSASVPAGFNMANTFIHVHIYDSTNHVNWHVVGPVSATTTVDVPGMVLFSGTYTMDVAFVEDFALPSGTVAATLADDWSKLVRPLPQLLSQSTLHLTVN